MQGRYEVIIDAQVHLWGPNRADRPWLHGGPPATHLQRAVEAEEVVGVMDEAGVDRAVIVPPRWAPDGNDIAFAAARAHPGRFGVMGRFDPLAPGAAAQLEHWLDQPNALGMRFTFTDEGAIACLDEGGIEWFWKAAERLAMPLMIYPPKVCQKFHRIAERYPGLTLILDHLGLQQRARDEAAFVHFAEALSLSRHANVYAKVSSLPAYTSERYPFPGLSEPIRRAYDAFGPQRLLWGTDYTKLPCSYRECLDHFRVALDFLTDRDKEWILGRTATTVLGWGA